MGVLISSIRISEEAMLRGNVAEKRKSGKRNLKDDRGGFA